ncbi:Eco29kI restriction endonuclease [Desulfotomaculum arcticum]|uniref:Eco29kI restriction endonuclease n=1 Tax=Desulfotruncus arcticus DSM 17038 TaxID=1121424 RepID=A0A1I2ZGT0_9FIRM|nr:Eco29kI family restriction endonuclease [Desulfotruncus arcticus]SFH36930.1 Eco29kI restriction endonuclease [Desulfotomaculum arcticum] [Desulfotruncus arcticus DSM 17038]
MPKEDIPMIKPFNPLDKRNLGESVADALLETIVQPLPPAPFIGAGVYALYYIGSFSAYGQLSEVNRDGRFRYPIYVGKAVPAGARKGGLGLEVEHGQALCRRLAEHAESINAARNLESSDFFCRFLVVDDIWIPLAESMLIERFKPVWNRVLDGFGNHDPGKGRHSGKMPPWDCLHPGREWATRLQPCAFTKEQLEERVSIYLNEFFTHMDEPTPER